MTDRDPSARLDVVPAEVARRVRVRLAQPLPAGAAHRRGAPRPRRGWREGDVPSGAAPAAALALIHPRDGALRLALTVRSEELARHAGQVSLPGGRVEPGESVEDAALRETREELGVDPEAVEIAGRLTSLYVPVSGFAITPVVGVLHEPPRFVPDPAEVAAVIEPPLVSLFDSDRWRVETRTWRGERYEVPVLDVGGPPLWGATLMIVAELLEVIREALD